jgi:nitroreductase
MDHAEIKKAVIRSQHCQRNWDLEKTIPEDDIDLLTYSVTNCPSKQNIAFYKVHLITNRDVIEEIHSKTAGFKNYETGDYETNSQTLANLLIAFEAEDYMSRHSSDKVFRNDELWALDNGTLTDKEKNALERDANMAIGIAAGYINLTASILGYGTGCCACFNEIDVRNVIGCTNPIKLLMGVGFKNSSVNRRVHHKTGFVFPTKTKQEITVNHIK